MPLVTDYPWANPATWQNFADDTAVNADDYSCMTNNGVRNERDPIGNCCAYHQWINILMDEMSNRARDGRYSGKMENPLNQIFHEQRIIIQDGCENRNRWDRATYDAAASFIAHALRKSGCSEDCHCPEVFRVQRMGLM